MSKQINSPWANRIHKANEYHKEWSERFACDTLEEYYEGFQYKNLAGKSLESLGIRRPYTVNLTFSAIKRKIANITYTYPEFILKPRPGQMDWNQEFAVRSAQIKQDTVNTIISDPRMEFVEDIRLAALDSFFRFSVIETGYAADWKNPNKPKIELKSHENPEIPEGKDKAVEDEEVPENERIYTKWISAKRFRVSMSDNAKLKNCDWCGYYEFIAKSTLKNTKGIDFPANYDSTYLSLDISDAAAYFKDHEYSAAAAAGMVERGELCKVWHIWDNISKKRLLLLDGTFDELYSEDFERLPFSTYRADISLKGWYPIPPVWQWLSPQNEVNEAREQMRRYRRRATRKFEYDKGKVDQDNLDKMKTEEDGTMVEVKGSVGVQVIRPIQNPNMDHSITDGLITAKDDFDIVSSQPVARGRASDRQTATATRQIATDQSIIESLEQIDFSRFVSAIGREVLLQSAEKMSRGQWVKRTIDPGSQESILGEIQNNEPIYEYITSQQLVDGFDFDIICNVINSTPEQMEKEKRSFIEFLSLVQSYPAIAMSATLIRETAYRTGYKNERVIAEYQTMARLALMEKANMAGQSLVAQGLIPQGNSDNGANAGRAQQQMPNTQSEIESQLMNQVGV